MTARPRRLTPIEMAAQAAVRQRRWRGTLSAVESSKLIDTGPGNDRPARGGCRPPPRWAVSRWRYLALYAGTRDACNFHDPESGNTFQWIGDRV